jgi:putative ABC transport system permease protein
MIVRLVLENVRHRPLRTLLSILLIAIPVTLILSLIGLSNGFLEDSRKRSAGVGADIIFKPPGGSLMSFSSGSMPQKFVDLLKTEPHVALATGTVVQPIAGFDSINGIDLSAFEKMSGGFVYTEGHGFQGPDDVLIDTYYANQRKVHAGGKINLLNRDWKVAGVVEPGKLAHTFAPLASLQDLIGSTGKLSQIFLKLDDPKNADTVVAALKAKYDGYGVWSIAEMQSLISVDSIPLLKNFINVILGIGVIIGFAVVSLSMYMAVLQRTREIGILKSLGATTQFIMSMIMAEAFCLGLGGTIVGILFSYAARYAMHAVAPASLPLAIVYSSWPMAGGVAMGAALLGAIYPGLMAVRQDPIEALAHE